LEFDVLEDALADGWISKVLRPVKSGKEATIYLCRGSERSGAELVAAKLYRERAQRSFRNDAVYWEGGMRAYSRRHRLAATKKTRFGQEVRFGGWMQREWDALRTLAAAGVRVPRPIEKVGEAILMEWLGDEDGAAPQLRHSDVRGEEAAGVRDELLRQVERTLAANLVHGDLSEYNVLLSEDGWPVIIDWPQAFDPRFNREAHALLERDIANLARFFGTRAAGFDAEAAAHDLWRRWLNSDLEIPSVILNGE
ncbi:MAG: phosphotransferase, partial [Chloroflexi bacterium]|nr:phosphotransferase [Chloroflexota bacterium]